MTDNSRRMKTSLTKAQETSEHFNIIIGRPGFVMMYLFVYIDRSGLTIAEELNTTLMGEYFVVCLPS